MSKFEEFLNHEDDDLADIARSLSDYETMLEVGQISESEFNELADDLLEYTKIDELSDDLERQVMYKKAFDALKKIVSIIGGL